MQHSPRTRARAKVIARERRPTPQDVMALVVSLLTVALGVMMVSPVFG